MRAVRVLSAGGPSVLQLQTIPPPVPREGEVLIRNAFAGVNFIDTYFRTGKYAMPMPFTVGVEGGGIVVGDGHGFKDGDRVAYWDQRAASYAEFSAVPAARLVKVPDALSMEDAVTCMTQGMTAHYLLRSTFPIAAGHVALVHAAAGGMGQILTQFAKHLGATVVATCGSEAKTKIAVANGADHVINYNATDFVAEVRALFPHGVDVVYDGVGASTCVKGFRCLKPRGMMVLYGAASGPVDPIDPKVLLETGSTFLTRPSLVDYARTAEEVQWRAGEVFALVTGGKIKIEIGAVLPLEEAAEAHTRLEGRATTGKVLLRI